jgi:hypothetical protein
MWTDYLSFDELPKAIDPVVRVDAEREPAAVGRNAAADRPQRNTRRTSRRQGDTMPTMRALVRGG